MFTDLPRRRFLQGTAAVGTAAAAGFAAPAIAQDVRELKMVTSWPKNYPGLGTSAERFAQRLELASGGRFRVRVFAGGELVHPLKAHDAVQEGTAELYHSADYYYTGKHKAYSFFTAVPFGLTPNETYAWLHFGGGQALWDEVGAEFGIKHLSCGNTGPQAAGWFREPIESLDDLKGLKMRTPGLGGEIFTALGATVVTLAGGEILPALEAGTIDAAEWVGPWNDLAFGLYRIAPNYYFPGYQEPSAVLSLGINRQFWDSLSESDQMLFQLCAWSETLVDMAEFDANNAAALRTLVNEHGVQVREFPDEVIVALGEAAREVLTDVAGSDDLTQRVHDSYMAFRSNTLGWDRVSSLATLRGRELIGW